MRILGMLFLGLCLGVAAKAETVLTYPELVNRLTHLEYLAIPPVTGEKCMQFSSYDRASKYDSATDTYTGWDANGDWGGCVRMEDKQMVMAEMEGPGCIWRIWCPEAHRGNVKIYLDGNEEPAVDMPFIEYFDRTQAPFNYSELNHYTARGWNSYVPIPFQKSCKIVGDPDWGSYYQFTYSTFPKDTKLPTFTRNLSETDLWALEEANCILKGTKKQNPWANEKIDGKVQLNMGKGDVLNVAELKGPEAITEIRAKFFSPADDTPEITNLLREMVLRITWDNQDIPAVEVPFGDFFGTAFGANPYKSLPSGYANEEWYSRWYMPFRENAKIEIINQGNTPASFEILVKHAPIPPTLGGKLNYFHAKWHRDAFLPEKPELKAIDWTFLTTKGNGRYCGLMLHVWNPKGAWWGEGDEKFYIDGEKFPSTFGTGSEDYFGYGWCNPTLFQNAFHNQTLCMNNNKGHISVNRWQIGDNIPFEESFFGTLEKYFPNDRPTLYACTAYWYLSEDGVDPYRLAPVEERIGYWYPIEDYRVKGAVEGESMNVIACTKGKYVNQDLSSFTDGKWSNDNQLWWRDGEKGDKIVLEFFITQEKEYDVTAAFTKAKDYGIFQTWLDGRKIGPELDLYNPSVISSGPIKLGKQILKKGSHQITFEIVGKNKEAEPRHMLGLDYLLFE